MAALSHPLGRVSKLMDFMEFSADGDAVLAFDTRLKALTFLDSSSGEEIDRVVLYAKGLVDPAGISVKGASLLVVDPKKPAGPPPKRGARPG